MRISIITVDGKGYLGEYKVSTKTLSETSEMKGSMVESFNFRVRQMLRDNLRTITVAGNTSVTVQELSPTEIRNWDATNAKMKVAKLTAVPNLIIKEFSAS